MFGVYIPGMNASKIAKLQFDLDMNARGFKVYRSSNNIATTVECTDGTKFEVLDAKYRHPGLQFGIYGIDASGVTNFKDPAEDIKYICGTFTTMERVPLEITYDVLYSKYNQFAAVSAKADNDIYMTFTTNVDAMDIQGVPPVEYCRSILYDTSNMLGYDLPNVLQAACIFAMSEEINYLDPTKDEYPDTALVTKLDDSTMLRLGTWTVNEHNSLAKQFCISSEGELALVNKAQYMPVIPVRELA